MEDREEGGGYRATGMVLSVGGERLGCRPLWYEAQLRLVGCFAFAGGSAEGVQVCPED